jgi:M-phase inducer phosphatase
MKQKSYFYYFRCRIIDARYCYEFEGGHIRGAENFGTWEEEAFLAEFFPPSLEAKMLTPKPEGAAEGKDENSCKENDKREILIFHCEFSSARGPALMRLLRKK